MGVEQKGERGGYEEYLRDMCGEKGGIIGSPSSRVGDFRVSAHGPGPPPSARRFMRAADNFLPTKKTPSHPSRTPPPPPPLPSHRPCRRCTIYNSKTTKEVTKGKKQTTCTVKPIGKAERAALRPSLLDSPPPRREPQSSSCASPPPAGRYTAGCTALAGGAQAQEPARVAECCRAKESFPDTSEGGGGEPQI